MTRDVFPREADRAVVAAFMRQRACKHPGSPLVSSGEPNASLAYDTGFPVVHATLGTLAWFVRSGGALYGKLVSGIAYNPGVQAIHHILDLLGLPGARVVRELARPGVPGALHFFDNQPVALGQPFLMCGPLGVQAWRAGMDAANT